MFSVSVTNESNDLFARCMFCLKFTSGPESDLLAVVRVQGRVFFPELVQVCFDWPCPL